MLRINNKINEVQYFHCGAASSLLSQSREKIEYREHTFVGEFKPGLTVEFPLKPGKVTFARVGEVKSKYRMISYTGNAVKSDMFVRGNPAKIILDKKPEYIINSLIEHGAEHHQIEVPDDITNKFKMFCEFLNLYLIIL